MASVHGCPVMQADALWRFYDNLKVLIAVTMLAIGGGLLVFGGRHPKIAFEVQTTVIVGTVLILSLYELYLPIFVPEWTVWLGIYVCYGMGTGLGLGAARWPRLGIVVIGVTIGALLGKFIDLVVI